jgi:phthalate 4,5-dioxygenase
MGAIANRTREHLGTTDKVIIANRRMLLQAIDTVSQGLNPNEEIPHTLHTGPDTVDCIAPAEHWETFWQQTSATKRANSPWKA